MHINIVHDLELELQNQTSTGTTTSAARVHHLHQLQVGLGPLCCKGEGIGEASQSSSAALLLCKS